MALLTRGDLLSQNSRRYAEVKLPTGGICRLRSLTAAEMRSFKASVVDVSGELHARRGPLLNELLLARTLVDEEGKRLFTDDDVLNGLLDDLDGATIAALYQAARRHTGFATDDDFAAVEASVKNSENGQASVSN